MLEFEFYDLKFSGHERGSDYRNTINLKSYEGIVWTVRLVEVKLAIGKEVDEIISYLHKIRKGKRKVCPFFSVRQNRIIILFKESVPALE